MGIRSDKPRKAPRQVTYTDSDFEHREGTLDHTNGNLSWIEGKDGQGDYYAPHEWKDE